ncbi:hypothetical protein SAMN04515667_1495 [Formosa sp. Hel1_31_208]|uniref:DUF2147 domain-containing protein n=1 Tax=Formosa sp. Hel1_31_208 TaxID=1798225 RepID=UPI00087D5F52|nr:DUF2147 domain-containing protein [Formosa sp. Hel1_31_208]SDS13778.1 hypothetical protein SAMN04515667_1495 [Formosa sp. Hel1_31_208]
MNKSIIVILMLLMTVSASAQSIFGKWKTIDDETGEEKSVVEIYEDNGKVYGKIIDIFDPEKRDLPCKPCNGEDYNKPVLGLKIIKDMEPFGETYKKGTIMNPEDGKVYDCRLKLDDDPNRLQVRGYIAFFYRTQYWVRIDS